MKWADAIKDTGRAWRKAQSDDEPNVILNDPKFPKAPKAFHAVEHYAWVRIPLKDAGKFEDWESRVEAGWDYRG